MPQQDCHAVYSQLQGPSARNTTRCGPPDALRHHQLCAVQGGKHRYAAFHRGSTTDAPRRYKTSQVM